MGNMYCTNCSEQIANQAEICPKCGVRTFTVKKHCHGCGNSVNENQELCVNCGVMLKVKNQTQAVNSSDNPVIMGILSFFITGLGQLVMGQTLKGITMFVGAVIIMFVTFGLASIVVVAISVIDAVLIAKKKQSGKVVGDWEFF